MGTGQQIVTVGAVPLGALTTRATTYLYEVREEVADVWRATGRITGTLEERRARHRTASRRINAFHQAARADPGVQGGVTGEKHPERDLLLPPTRRSPRQPSPGQ